MPISEQRRWRRGSFSHLHSAMMASKVHCKHDNSQSLPKPEMRAKASLFLDSQGTLGHAAPTQAWPILLAISWKAGDCRRQLEVSRSLDVRNNSSLQSFQLKIGEND